jgi:RimJ/RimL family protein N-acetyltransferase
MRRKEYASKALRTLISLYRAKKVHFPEAKCFSFYTTDNNKAMLKVAQKVEFEETASPDSQGLMSLFGGIFFKKPFDKQMPLPRTNQIISSDSNFNSISQSLITHDVTTLFNVGETFSGKSNAHIYLKYAAEIDIENVMKQPIKKFGFKIFRTLEKDEIGYIVPNYFVTPGCIDIEAVWINKDMRHKNYCSEAIMAFMSTYMSKKVYFPEAKYFSFFTTENNKAMHRVAQKVNFVHAIPSKEIKLMVLCGGRFFRKPFDNGK